MRAAKSHRSRSERNRRLRCRHRESPAHREASLPRTVSGPRALRAQLRARRCQVRFGAGDQFHARCLRNPQYAWPRAGSTGRQNSRAVLRRLGNLRPQLLRRRGAGRGAAVAIGRTSRSACNSCAGTSTVGTTTVRRITAKCTPPPMPPASSSRIPTKAGSTAGRNRKPRRNSRSACRPPNGPAAAVQGVSVQNCGGMYAIPNLRLLNHQLPAAGY